jgi:hypothetical protein
MLINGKEFVMNWYNVEVWNGFGMVMEIGWQTQRRWVLIDRSDVASSSCGINV